MEKKTRKEQIEIEVEKTLSSFDQAERIEASPHFSTRLLARIRDLDSRTETPTRAVFFYRPLLPVLLGLMIAINIIFAVLMFNSGITQTQARSDSIATMASYYGLQESDLDLYISYQ